MTTGSWEDHSAHPSMNNPQYLIKLPIISQAGSRFADATGKHQLEIRAERTDGGGETMNLTLYKSITGKQFLEPPEASLKLAESSNTADRKTATCSATTVVQRTRVHTSHAIGLCTLAPRGRCTGRCSGSATSTSTR